VRLPASWSRVPGALSAAEANLGLEGPEHRRGCWIEAAQGLTGGGRGGAPLRAVTRRRLGLARRIGVDGGVRLGRLKGPGGDRGGAQRDNDPGVLAGDLGALLRGGEEGKGEREPLTGGAVLVSGGERVARALTGGVGRAGSQGSRPARARAGLRVRERGRGLAEALAWARAGLGRARGGKERKTGPAGERNRAGRRERGAWVGFGTKLGWVLLGFGLALGFGLLFYFPFSFLFLLQTKFEFKSKFDFKPHSNKIMHQHECNKNLNL